VGRIPSYFHIGSISGMDSRIAICHRQVPGKEAWGLGLVNVDPMR
jgi:hypothetical protein